MPINPCLFLIPNLMSLADFPLYWQDDIQKGEYFFMYFALSAIEVFLCFVWFAFLFLSYEIVLERPKKTRSGFHFVSSTLCDLVHIPDMLQTACVSECAVSVFSGESP